MQAQQPKFGEMVARVVAEKLAQGAFVGGKGRVGSEYVKPMHLAIPGGPGEETKIKRQYVEPGDPRDIEQLPMLMHSIHGRSGRVFDPAAVEKATEYLRKGTGGRAIANILNPFSAMRGSNLPGIGTGSRDQVQQLLASYASTVGAPGDPRTGAPSLEQSKLEQLTEGGKGSRALFKKMLPEINTRLSALTGTSGKGLGSGVRRLLEMSKGPTAAGGAFSPGQGALGGMNIGAASQQTPFQMPWGKIGGGIIGAIVLNRLLDSLGMGGRR